MILDPEEVETAIVTSHDDHRIDCEMKFHAPSRQDRIKVHFDDVDLECGDTLVVSLTSRPEDARTFTCSDKSEDHDLPALTTTTDLLTLTYRTDNSGEMAGHGFKLILTTHHKNDPEVTAVVTQAPKSKKKKKKQPTPSPAAVDAEDEEEEEEGRKPRERTIATGVADPSDLESTKSEAKKKKKPTTSLTEEAAAPRDVEDLDTKRPAPAPAAAGGGGKKPQGKRTTGRPHGGAGGRTGGRHGSSMAAGDDDDEDEEEEEEDEEEQIPGKQTGSSSRHGHHRRHSTPRPRADRMGQTTRQPKKGHNKVPPEYRVSVGSATGDVAPPQNEEEEEEEEEMVPTKKPKKAKTKPAAGNDEEIEESGRRPTKKPGQEITIRPREQRGKQGSDEFDYVDKRSGELGNVNLPGLQNQVKPARESQLLDKDDRVRDMSLKEVDPVYEGISQAAQKKYSMQELLFLASSQLDSYDGQVSQERISRKQLVKLLEEYIEIQKESLQASQDLLYEYRQREAAAYGRRLTTTSRPRIEGRGGGGGAMRSPAANAPTPLTPRTDDAVCSVESRRFSLDSSEDSFFGLF